MRGALLCLLAACAAPDITETDERTAEDDLASRSEVLAAVHRVGAWHLTVLLTDDEGAPVEARPGAFAASADGADVPVEARRLSGDPGGEPWLSVALVIDERAADPALAALRFLLNTLATPVEVEVIRVAGEVRVSAPFEDPDPLDAATAEAPGDGRRLLDGVARAVEDLARRETPLRLVWVIAAGPDEGSASTGESVRAAAAGIGAVVFASGSVDASPGDLAAWSTLYAYDPATIPDGAAHARMATQVPALWSVRIEVPRGTTVDLRITTDVGTIELAHPTGG